MKIIRMNMVKNDGSKILAFFDLQTDDEVIIKGFKIVKGPKGNFVSVPSEKGKDGNYYDNVILPEKIKKDVEKMALEDYEKSK